MNDRIEHTVCLASRVVENWKLYKEDKAEHTRRQIDFDLSDLISFMLDSYIGGFSVDDLKLVFDHDGNLLDTKYLHTLPQAIIPVAVMREVMGRRRVIVSRKRIPVWEQFSKRYGDFIVQF